MYENHGRNIQFLRPFVQAYLDGSDGQLCIRTLLVKQPLDDVSNFVPCSNYHISIMKQDGGQRETDLLDKIFGSRLYERLEQPRSTL